ncbi:MAG TPA: hypothetical protein VG345_06275 [Bryobacteraceae bacterium]|nr:hypothetical protein [Bryobacteraceae bacterium]
MTTIIRYPDSFIRIVLFVAAILTVPALESATLQLPLGNRRLISPDGAWLLYGVPAPEAGHHDPQLWLENLRTHHKARLQDVPDTLRAAWFPDSRQFWVEDHSASDETEACIYNPATLHRLDIRRIVLAADPSGHRYYSVESAAARNLVIDLKGHTGDWQQVSCFDIHYRVSRTGAVEKLSGRIWPIRQDPNRCR